MNPIAQYLIWLALTIFAYSAYAQFAVPAIEGPPNLIKRRVPAPLASDQKPADRIQQYKWLFPPDAWELDSSNMLQTAQGKILFQDYQTEPDGTLIVFPFTLIMERKAEEEKTDAGRQPTVLRCLQEARIKFDRPLTMSGSDHGDGTGRMESAQLRGEVVIYRPPTSEEKDDSMRITTRNVQIEKQHIYTLENVGFQFGPNHGRGRKLLVELTHSGPANSITSDISQVNGIQRIELAFLEKMTIDPNQNRVRGVDPKPTSSEFLSGGKAPLDITCAGPFVFDVAAGLITFRDQVVVTQMDPIGDDLRCEKLMLTLDSNDKTAINPIKESDSGMKLSKITAVGSPAIINARSRNTRITGDELNYELHKKLIDARSQTGSVTIVNEQYQFDSRSFQYTLPDDNSLGPLIARGPGRMLRTETEQEGEFRASWKEKLIVVTESNGTKLIQLDGGTKVSLNQDTRIDSDHLRLWLWPVPKTNLQPSSKSSQQKWDYQPARLLAYGNVEIDSPKLAGTARELIGNWPPPEPKVSQNQSSRSESLVVAKNRVKRPTYQDPPTTKTEMIAPTNRNAQIRLAGFNAPLERQRKFRFEADKVDAKLSSQASGSKIQQVKLDGNVFIEEIVTQNPGDKQLKVTGERLDMTPVGKESYQIFVIGSAARKATVDAEGLQLSGDRLEMLPQGPELYRVNVMGSRTHQAVVASDELVLEGVAVHLDQTANRLWVDGAGNMKMTARPPAANAKPQITSIGKGASQIDVSWGGGMVFDGRTIYFENNVIMLAEQASDSKKRKTKTLSQALSVRLEQQVNFRALSNRDRKLDREVKIDELVLVDHLDDSERVFHLASLNQRSENRSPIVIENYDFDARGQLVEKQKVIVPKATVEMATGKIKADGPGTIINYRQGQSSVAFGNKKQRQNGNPNQLSCLQVNFDGTLNANMESEDIKISGNVRMLYAPVKNWDESINPDVVVKIPIGAVKLTCDNIEVSKWEPRGAAEAKREMIATGNAHIYGDLYEATSDRVSYDQSTDILVIEGTPRTDANLWYQPNPRATRNHLVAGKILFRVSDQWTSVQKIKNGSFSPSGRR